MWVGKNHKKVYFLNLLENKNKNKFIQVNYFKQIQVSVWNGTIFNNVLFLKIECNNSQHFIKIVTNF